MLFLILIFVLLVDGSRTNRVVRKWGLGAISPPTHVICVPYFFTILYIIVLKVVYFITSYSCQCARPQKSGQLWVSVLGRKKCNADWGIKWETLFCFTLSLHVSMLHGKFVPFQICEGNTDENKWIRFSSPQTWAIWLWQQSCMLSNLKLFQFHCSTTQFDVTGSMHFL